VPREIFFRFVCRSLLLPFSFFRGGGGPLYGSLALDFIYPPGSTLLAQLVAHRALTSYFPGSVFPVFCSCPFFPAGDSPFFSCVCFQVLFCVVFSFDIGSCLFSWSLSSPAIKEAEGTSKLLMAVGGAVRCKYFPPVQKPWKIGCIEDFKNSGAEVEKYLNAPLVLHWSDRFEPANWVIAYEWEVFKKEQWSWSSSTTDFMARLMDWIIAKGSKFCGKGLGKGQDLEKFSGNHEVWINDSVEKRWWMWSFEWLKKRM